MWSATYNVSTAWTASWTTRATCCGPRSCAPRRSPRASSATRRTRATPPSSPRCRRYGPLSQQELAKGLNVNRTVMVKLIDGLEAQRLRRARPQPAGPARLRAARHPCRPGVDGRDAAADGARGRRARPRTSRSAEHERLNALLRALIETPPPRAGRPHRVPARPRPPPLPRARGRSAQAVRHPGPPVRRADAPRGRDLLPARARRPPAGQHAGRGRARRRARGGAGWSSAGATRSTGA